MKTKVISALPACGKTHFFENNKKYSCLDSDSSKFSWILDENGVSTGKRNPDFPNNYIQHIKENIGKVDFIFVSSHDDVRRALEDNLITYILVIPEPSLKAEWIGRCWLRGSDENFLRLIDSQWDNWVNPVKIYQECDATGIVWLQSGEYLSTKIDWFNTFVGN